MYYRMSFYIGPLAFEMLEEQEMCMTLLYVGHLRQICVMLSCFGKGWHIMRVRRDTIDSTAHVPRNGIDRSHRRKILDIMTPAPTIKP